MWKGVSGELYDFSHFMMSLRIAENAFYTQHLPCPLSWNGLVGGAQAPEDDKGDDPEIQGSQHSSRIAMGHSEKYPTEIIKMRALI